MSGVNWDEDDEETSPTEGLGTETDPPLEDVALARTDADLVEEIENEEDPSLGHEVEGRIQLVQHYNTLLGNGYLFRSRNRFADHVNEEVRQFIRGRLMELLGMQESPTLGGSLGNQFTAEEAAALKAFAAVWQAKKVAASSAVASASPQIRRADLPSPETPAPAVTVPEPRRVSPLLAAARRTGAKIVVKASDQRDQHVIARLPDKYREDPTLKVKAGRASVQMRDLEGQPIWEKKGAALKPVVKDITPPTMPAQHGQQPIPTPTPEQAEILGMQEAVQLAQRTSASPLGKIITKLARGDSDG